MSLTNLALAAALVTQTFTPFQPAKPPAVAQQPAPPATLIAAPVMTNAILRVGTEVPLRLSEELTTKGKKLRVGHRFHLQTSEPVMVEGVNVVPVGSPAVGEITAVRNKGMWGKSGHFGARILYMTVNGRQVRLSGAFDDKGVAGGIGAAAVSAIVFLPAGFFMTGTSAVVPAGSIVKSFVDEDVPFAAIGRAAVKAQGESPAQAVTIPIAAQDPKPVVRAEASNVPVPTPHRLDLTCFGGGTANKLSVATIDSSSDFSGSVGTTPFSGSGSGSATVMGSRQQNFGDQVDVRLFGGDDRIRLPRTMLPPLRGGKEGWFKLKNVVADARSIRASAAVNFINNPKVFIDRVTGTISISGKAGDYAGRCQVIDSTVAPKF